MKRSIAIIFSGLILAIGFGPFLAKVIAQSDIDPFDVVISKVAWLGTPASANDEWIELYINTDVDIDLTSWRLFTVGTPDATLNGTVPAGECYLLECTNDTSVPNRKADQIYAGALFNNPGEIITLNDYTSLLIDIVGLEASND